MHEHGQQLGRKDVVEDPCCTASGVIDVSTGAPCCQSRLDHAGPLQLSEDVRQPAERHAQLIGAVYAAAIADQNFTVDDVFTRLVGSAGGTVLELGSGTGRSLLRLLEAGHDVHGVEISEEMTRRCLAEAARRGLDPVVHHGSFAPLEPSLHGYAAVFCPLNAFSFVSDDDLARESVASYVSALVPGGVLALAGSAGDDSLGTSTDWVQRADVPVEDGLLARVRERRTPVDEGRCLRVEREIQVVDAAGQVHREQQGRSCAG